MQHILLVLSCLLFIDSPYLFWLSTRISLYLFVCLLACMSASFLDACICPRITHRYPLVYPRVCFRLHACEIDRARVRFCLRAYKSDRADVSGPFGLRSC